MSAIGATPLTAAGQPSLSQRAAGTIRHPLSLTLRVLTFTTGLVDAVSYLGIGHVFTANMTGNIVFLGFGIAGSGGLPVVARSRRGAVSACSRSAGGARECGDGRDVLEPRAAAGDPRQPHGRRDAVAAVACLVPCERPSFPLVCRDHQLRRGAARGQGQNGRDRLRRRTGGEHARPHRVGRSRR